MKRLRTGFFIFVTLTLSACAPRTKAAPPSQETQIANTPPHIEVETPKAQLVLNTAEMTCANPSDCPNSIAMLVATLPRKSKGKSTTTEIQQCTSFLVSDSVMATNTHCIPEDLRSKGASCAGRIEFVFANGAQPSVKNPGRAQCSEVISVTSINENPESADYLRLPDVAFLRLQEPVLGVTPFHFDANGTSDGVKLKTYAIDPLATEAIGGVLVARTCTTAQGTLANPSYIDPFAAVMTATQCETKRGNSGAPAVDEAGSVRGVLFGVLPPEISNANRYKSFETPTQFKVMSFITNAACIDLPTGVAAHGKRADLDVCNRRLSAKDLVQRSMHDTNSGLESQLKLWIPSAPPMLTFHIQPIKSQLSNTGLPLVTCVKNISTWLPKEKSIPQGLENFSSVGSTIQLRYRAPIFSLKAALDEHYRVYSKPATIDYALVDLSFDEADLNTNGHTTVSESIGSEGGALKPTTARQDLKICL